MADLAPVWGMLVCAADVSDGKPLTVLEEIVTRYGFIWDLRVYEMGWRGLCFILVL